ncbi:hypothetical protein NN561_008974 [Cricetulus griseus]
MPFLRWEPLPSPSHRRARRGHRASGECRGRRFALSPPGAASPRRVSTAALASSVRLSRNRRSRGGARSSARRAAGPPGPRRGCSFLSSVHTFPTRTGSDPEKPRLLPAGWLLLRPGDTLRAQVPAGPR